MYNRIFLVLASTNKASNYQTVSVQLLDLMHTLLTQAASTYASSPLKDESVEQMEPGIGKLWSKCWCPLLQGMARLVFREGKGTFIRDANDIYRVAHSTLPHPLVQIMLRRARPGSHFRDHLLAAGVACARPAHAHGRRVGILL